ncbi:hypothetical protein M0R19_06645 [Candidatus Pacearchaeota archaeon]|nr:hypothetical protein [Candidatus Pacearchaeota archaeon]
MKKNKKFFPFVKKNHFVIFLLLVILFLLLWNLDRYFTICPYGLIPLIIGVILEIIILIRGSKK